MTVVVGFIGPDGAVMASDSESTESGHTRFDVADKCWISGPFLFGYTGNVAVKQRLKVAIESYVAQLRDGVLTPRAEVRNSLTAALLPELQTVYQQYAPLAIGGNPLTALGGVLLVIGRDDDGYWILEIDHENTATFYDERGFQTVGSGSSAAHVTLSVLNRYEAPDRTVAHLKLIAFRTVATCIDVLGGRSGVGGEVHIWSSKDGSDFAKVSDEESERIATAVDTWLTIERESLTEIVLDGAESRADESVEIDMPDQLGSTSDHESLTDTAITEASATPEAR